MNRAHARLAEVQQVMGYAGRPAFALSDTGQGVLPCAKPKAQLSQSVPANADNFKPRHAPRAENQRLMASPRR